MLSVFTGEMDYRDIPIPEKLVELPYPAEMVRSLILRRCERGATFEELSIPAEDKDIVILTYEEKGLEKKKHVNIGKGSNVRLEKLCLGKVPGDLVNDIEAHIKMEYKVETIVRKIIPELTDELMSVIEPDRKISASEYRDELVKSVEEKPIIKSATAMFNIIVNNAVKQDTFELNGKEVADLVDEYYEMFRDYGHQQGLSAEEAIKNAIKNEKQNSDLTEMEYLRNMAVKEIKKAVLCSYFLGKEKAAEDENVSYAELVSGLQDQFYDVIFEYIASKIKWQEG